MKTATDPAEAAAVPVRGLARVISNEVDGPGRKLLLEMPTWPGAQPGQFVMVGAGAEAGVPRYDPLLPRPMAVYREPGAGLGENTQFELLYRLAGRGTQLLAEAEPGDEVTLVGPLGRGFPILSSTGPALLVGGGTGIASLYELAKALLEAGRSVAVLLGARSGSDLMGVAEFEALAAESPDRFEMIFATEDGSRGTEGFVTVPLAERLAGATAGGEAENEVFACGPTPMMRAAAELAEDRGIRCYVSLENPMACGFGVCLGCAAPRREGGFSLVCRQGPVFESTEINWEGLA